MRCGLSWERASRMGLQQLRMVVTARNESMSGGHVGEESGVRDATQADIRAFVG